MMLGFADATSIFYAQETLAQYKTPDSTTVTKTTNSTQKLYSQDCYKANSVLHTYRTPQFIISHWSADGNLGEFKERGSWTTVSKGTTKSFGSNSTGYATITGNNLMKISTQTSYSDDTWFWGTWTYDL
ncbi:MAG: hypothetical protein RSA91_05560 [Bacilli bacterium]